MIRLKTVCRLPSRRRRTTYRAKISKEEINQLPLFRYTGPVHLVRTDEQAARALREIRRERVLGFDTETRAVFQRGVTHLPSLVQIATSSSVYLFQLARLTDKGWFKDILGNPALVKAGVSVAHDIRQLKLVHAFHDRNFVELAELADQAGIHNNGLRGLAAILLGCRISKGAQRSDWSRDRLSQSQIEYAATDAWISREIYVRLVRYLDEGY